MTEDRTFRIVLPGIYGQDAADRFAPEIECEAEFKSKTVVFLVGRAGLEWLKGDAEHYASGWLVEDLGADYRRLQSSARRAHAKLSRYP